MRTHPILSVSFIRAAHQTASHLCVCFLSSDIDAHRGCSRSYIHWQADPEPSRWPAWRPRDFWPQRCRPEGGLWSQKYSSAPNGGPAPGSSLIQPFMGNRLWRFRLQATLTRSNRWNVNRVPGEQGPVPEDSEADSVCVLSHNTNRTSAGSARGVAVATLREGEGQCIAALWGDLLWRGQSARKRSQNSGVVWKPRSQHVSKEVLTFHMVSTFLTPFSVEPITFLHRRGLKSPSKEEWDV